jgi:hypothetical protein
MGFLERTASASSLAMLSKIFFRSALAWFKAARTPLIGTAQFRFCVPLIVKTVRPIQGRVQIVARRMIEAARGGQTAPAKGSNVPPHLQVQRAITIYRRQAV